jgi:hypothetical protein
LQIHHEGTKDAKRQKNAAGGARFGWIVAIVVAWWRVSRFFDRCGAAGGAPMQT